MNTLQQIIDLRDESLYLTQKFQWDPYLGPAHESYLDKLNEIINEYCHNLQKAG